MFVLAIIITESIFKPQNRLTFMAFRNKKTTLCFFSPTKNDGYYKFDVSVGFVAPKRTIEMQLMKICTVMRDQS